MGKPGNGLPGASYLLPPDLGRQVPGILSHAGRAGTAALNGNKGAITVAPGINAFASPATSAPGTGVASDGSLGSGAVSYNGSEYTIPASVGTQVGGNLFESFSQFNLLQGEIADFQGPSSVQNILARVTGGSASSIDGSIQCDIQGANLFLINPAGVMFGPNASLNVSGAFTVSTANYVSLAHGGKFDASLAADDMLSAAPVSAFGFLNPAPAAVSFSGSQLSVPAGTGLNVIAGDVTLDSATLGAPSGGLTIFSAASAGEVPFSLTAPGAGYDGARFNALGALSLSNGSSIAIGGAGGGVMVIRAGIISVDDSLISSFNTGALTGGNISINAGDLSISGGLANFGAATGIFTNTDASGDSGNVVMTVADQLVIYGGGEINTYTSGNGNAGNIMVTARDITVSGNGFVLPSGIVASTVAAGDAGAILVNADHLFLDNGGEISSSSTFGLGNGGNVKVTAGDILISGASSGMLFISGIFALGAGGDGGSIVVNAAGALDMEGSGRISSSTSGPGSGGSVQVTAGETVITGAGSGIFASTDGSGEGGIVEVTAQDILISGGGIFANSHSSGSAGSLVVTAEDAIDLEDGGEISSSTFAQGNGGHVRVTAQRIMISGVTPAALGSGIFAETVSSGQGGPAGSILVTAEDALDIEDGGQISSSTAGLGNGGSVEVNAPDITIAGATPAGFVSGIFANSSALARGGAAGDVSVTAADALDIEDGGEISSSTLGLGQSGSVKVTAHDIFISGFATGIPSDSGFRFPSGIFAESESPTQGGNAGGISIQCYNLTLDAGGTISTNALAASAGDITVNAQQDVTLEDQSLISSSAGISGGNIALNVGELLYVLDSSITATAGTLRNLNGGSNGNEGNGGNITIDPEFIALNDSLISANAAAGQGGNIVLDSIYYLNSGSTITATGATSGTVTITSPELDLSGALVGLPSAPVGSETQLQETCAMAINGDFSSFLAVGQGDVEAGPDEAQGGTAEDRRAHPGHRRPVHKSGIGL